MSSIPVVAQSAKIQHESHHESPLAKFVISGALSFWFELGFGYPAEFMKIAKQTTTVSYPNILKRAVSQKGIVGLLDGFFPWGSIYAVLKGAMFGVGHSISKNCLDGRIHDSFAEIAAGGMGGYVQGLSLSPVMLLKTRVMTNPAFRTSGSVMDTAAKSCLLGKQIVKQEGVRVLMKGADVFAAKRFADWTSRFVFVEVVEQGMKKYLHRTNLSRGEKCGAALAGGTLSALCTLPMDVIVAQLQCQNSGGVQEVSAYQIVKKQFKTGGAKHLLLWSYRGFVARVGHVALTTFLMKTISTDVYKYYKEHFGK
eukprot:TRINITY_DN4365_c1_g1_i1.p1 TRINITY_DN4365_c1_g1~~TRINITY_DN4365_c1_g1_i1.p1  ORF type:complete len:311 (-),score=81.00 TRINITY_DN4365_c1_g1_i1:523-1455(-)